jgi:hypothetical protein
MPLDDCPFIEVAETVPSPDFVAPSELPLLELSVELTSPVTELTDAVREDAPESSFALEVLVSVAEPFRELTAPSSLELDVGIP